MTLLALAALTSGAALQAQAAWGRRCPAPVCRAQATPTQSVTRPAPRPMGWRCGGWGQAARNANPAAPRPNGFGRGQATGCRGQGRGPCATGPNVNRGPAPQQAMGRGRGNGAGFQGQGPRGGRGNGPGFQGQGPRGGRGNGAGFQGQGPRGGRGNGAGFQGQGPRGGGAPILAGRTTTLTEVPASYVAALQSALASEHRARDFYRAAAASLQLPRFANLARAEENHAAAVTQMLRFLGATPAESTPKAPTAPANLEEADAACARIEREVIAAYDELITDCPDPALLPVLQNIQAANRRHLAAVSR